MVELIVNSPTLGYQSQLTTLAAPITTAPAPGTVETCTTNAAAGAPFQGGQFRITLVDAAGTPREIILVTSGQNGTTWTITRGVEGSTTVTHPAGAAIYHIWTAAGLATAFAAAGSGIPLAQKGAASGVATLDSGGLLPVAELPPSAVTASLGSAQDLFVASGSGSAAGRVSAGSAGQLLVVRSDGTLGYEDNIVSLKGWAVGGNANLGNGSNDDTAAIQAWATAVIAAGAKGIVPAPSNYYKITSTINLVPAPGATTATFSMEWLGSATSVRWAGPNGTDGARLAMFNCGGWKQGTRIVGLKPRIPTATYVTAFEIDNPCTRSERRTPLGSLRERSFRSRAPHSSRSASRSR